MSGLASAPARRVLISLTTCILLATACRRSSPGPVPTVRGVCRGSSASLSEAAAPAGRHIFVVVFENHSLDQIVGNDDAPTFTALARSCGVATNYRTIRHPSLPNYIAMVGGDTFGITSDCTGCHVNAPNLADQIEQARLTWRTYAEGMPEPCFLGSKAGNYRKKHNPLLYFDDIRESAGRCRRGIVPLTELRRDLARNAAPNFSLIVPDQCHDMHSCGVREGDIWLRRFLPTVLESRAYRDGGLVLVTFDEGSKGTDDRIATILASLSVQSGTRCSARHDHYSLLRTAEDQLGGLSPLGHARERTSLIGCFLRPPRPPGPSNPSPTASVS